MREEEKSEREVINTYLNKLCTVVYKDGEKIRNLDCTLVGHDERYILVRRPLGDVIILAKSVVERIEPRRNDKGDVHNGFWF